MSVIEIVFVCLIGILFVCVSFVVCLRYFHIFQQNHYSLSNTINYFYNTNNIQFTLQIILIGIIDFVAFDIINQIVCAIDLNYLYFISFPLLFYSLYICKYNKKSKRLFKYKNFRARWWNFHKRWYGYILKISCFFHTGSTWL